MCFDSNAVDVIISDDFNTKSLSAQSFQGALQALDGKVCMPNCKNGVGYMRSRKLFIVLSNYSPDEYLNATEGPLWGAFFSRFRVYSFAAGMEREKPWDGAIINCSEPQQ